jgi:hypothetical protein
MKHNIPSTTPTPTLQAINNYLQKHGPPHKIIQQTHTQTNIRITNKPNNLAKHYIAIQHHQPTNTIKTYTTHWIKENRLKDRTTTIDLADPQLLTKILQIIQIIQ